MVENTPPGGESLPAPSPDPGVAVPSEESSPRRGIPAAETLRGTLARFFPSSPLSAGTVFALVQGLGSDPLLDLLLAVSIGSGLLTLGYGLGLEGMRRWLFEDADVAGRRSVLAGLLSPLALFISAALLEGLGTIAGLLWLLFIGMGMAGAMFFPWLSGETDPGDPALEGIPDGVAGEGDMLASKVLTAPRMADPKALLDRSRTSAEAAGVTPEDVARPSERSGRTGEGCPGQGAGSHGTSTCARDARPPGNPFQE